MSSFGESWQRQGFFFFDFNGLGVWFFLYGEDRLGFEKG